MKNGIYFTMMVLLFVCISCSQETAVELAIPAKQKAVTFVCSTLEQDMESMKSIAVTRATGDSNLKADGTSMSDLWVYDYVDGKLKQTIHQTSSDVDFGKPTIKLDYGQHLIKLVASRGVHPTLSSSAISWEKASDTFVKEVELKVASGMESKCSVSLNRVATRLTVKMTDAVPLEAETLELNLSTWYKDLSFMSLWGTTLSDAHYSVNIKSLVGKKNGIVSVYSLSPSSEVWNTTVSITVKDSAGKVISQISVPTVQMKVNRTTVLSGELFGKSNQMVFSLNTQWIEDYAQIF